MSSQKILQVVRLVGPSLVVLLTAGILSIPSIALPQTDNALMLTVTVTDLSGNYVMGLPREAFRILDGKLMQPMRLSETDEPISIGILIDTSASMQDPAIQEFGSPKPITEAVAHFLELSNPNDEYFVMTFDKDPQVLIDWRKGKTLPQVEIAPPRDKHLTALYDACAGALDKFKEAHYPKRAIVLFSDGMDSGSNTRYVDLRRQLERTDVIVYVVSPRKHYMASADITALLREVIDREVQEVLGEIVQISGGLVYYTESRRELADAVERIAIEMRHQYRLAFQLASTGAGGNTWRRLKLEVVTPSNTPHKLSKLKVRTRRGYFGP